MSQIIHIADTIEINFHLENNDYNMQNNVLNLLMNKKAKCFQQE